MKKYGVPTNRWEVVARNLISLIGQHVTENHIKTLVIAFRKNAASPLLACLLKQVCEAYEVDLVSLSLLKSEEKLPGEVLDYYGNNIFGLSNEEQLFFEKNYTSEEFLEIQSAIARNTAKNYQNSLFISDVNKTEINLNERLICESDFNPFQELTGSEIFELADFFLLPSDYLVSLKEKDSREYYQELDKTIKEYEQLQAAQGLSQINKKENDSRLMVLEENALIKRLTQCKQANLKTSLTREELFKYGDARLD